MLILAVIAWSWHKAALPAARLWKISSCWAARVGLSDNTTVGEGAQIAAASGVHGDIPAGERWGGIPAKPMKQWIRELRALERLTRAKSGEDASKGE